MPSGPCFYNVTTRKGKYWIELLLKTLRHEVLLRLPSVAGTGRGSCTVTPSVCDMVHRFLRTQCLFSCETSFRSVYKTKYCDGRG